MDKLNEDFFSELFLLPSFSTLERGQLQLSTRSGGFGLRSHYATREAAYLGSWLDSFATVRSHCPVESLSATAFQQAGPSCVQAARAVVAGLEARGIYLAANGDVSQTAPQQAWAWLDGAQNLRQRQHAISAQEEVARREALLRQAAPLDRARIRSCGGWSAGAWLQVAPTQDLFTFDDTAFTTATRFRLGKDVGVPGEKCKHVYTNPGASENRCRKEVDPKGFHSLTCSVGGLEKLRHNRIRDLLHSMFTAAGYTSMRERLVPEWVQRRRHRAGGWSIRQAQLDLQLYHPPDDPVVYGDVVIGHPHALKYRRAAAVTDGATAAAKEREKHGRYPASRLVRGRLVPFAVETYGRWGDEAVKFFKTAAERAGQRHADLRCLGRNAAAAVSGKYATQLSCTLQKINVRMLIQSLGDSELLLSTSRPHIDLSSDWIAPRPDTQDADWTAQQVEDLLLHADSLRRLAVGNPYSRLGQEPTALAPRGAPRPGEVVTARAAGGVAEEVAAAVGGGAASEVVGDGSTGVGEDLAVVSDASGIEVPAGAGDGVLSGAEDSGGLEVEVHPDLVSDAAGVAAVVDPTVSADQEGGASEMCGRAACSGTPARKQVQE